MIKKCEDQLRIFNYTEPFQGLFKTDIVFVVKFDTVFLTAVALTIFFIIINVIGQSEKQHAGLTLKPAVGIEIGTLISMVVGGSSEQITDLQCRR